MELLTGLANLNSAKKYFKIIISSLYTIYLYRIFPKIKHLRGATRAKIILEHIISREHKKVDEPETLLKDIDWENLIIIDACRYDTFHQFLPESEHIISPGSRSESFIEANFSESSEFDEVVCITANPYFDPDLFEKVTGEKPDQLFHSVYPTYRKWDKKLDTVLPSQIIEDVKKAEREYPKKKKLIYLMQPHAPFIDDKPIGKGYRHVFDKNVSRNIIHDVWDKRLLNRISHDTVVERYENNVKLAIDTCIKINNILAGETTITSDHGNLLGENGLYGHKLEIKTSALRKVPLYHMKD